MFSDFDDDGTLDSGDLEKLVNCLTGETDDKRLTPEEMRQLINNVSEEPSVCGCWEVDSKFKSELINVGTTVVCFH